ncbi:MAG: DUF4350 domain-containing protein [Haloarculaceae archaeon]
MAGALDHDVDYPKVAVLVVLLVVNLALVGALASSSTPYGPYNADWDGATDLREEAAASADVHLAITTEPYATVPANRSVGVVLAPAGPSANATDSLARVRGFIARGGTLVVAGENATRTNAYLAAVGAVARVDGRTLRDEQNYYRGPLLPVAANVTDHPLTREVDGLTLNDGTAVRPRGATPLVNASGVAYLDGNGNGTLDAGEPLGPHPVATVESVGAGRVVVVSDPGAFTNAMLDRTGNRAFLAALFEGRSDVVLDYSGRSSLPPLVYALLVVRTAPLAQLLVGVGAFGFLALWAGRGRLAAAVESARDRLSGSSGSEPASGGTAGASGDLELDERGVRALLADRHPEWDDERVERVTEAIIRQRRRSWDDD